MFRGRLLAPAALVLEYVNELPNLGQGCDAGKSRGVKRRAYGVNCLCELVIGEMSDHASGCRPVECHARDVMPLSRGLVVLWAGALAV